MGRGTRKMMVSMAPVQRKAQPGRAHALIPEVRVYDRDDIYERGYWYVESGAPVAPIRLMTGGEKEDRLYVGPERMPSQDYARIPDVWLSKAQLRPFARWLSNLAEAAEDAMEDKSLGVFEGTHRGGLEALCEMKVSRVGDSTHGIALPTIGIVPADRGNAVVGALRFTPAVARAVCHDILAVEHRSDNRFPLGLVVEGRVKPAPKSKWPKSLVRGLSGAEFLPSQMPASETGSLADVLSRPRT